MNEKPEEKRKPFSERMIDILNYGALNLAMAIGYETGLFDVLDTFDAPADAGVLAEKAGLQERYVREWLGVMVSGGIVDLSRDPAGRDAFLLPKAHADLITRRAGNANLGVYTQEIPLLTRCAMEGVLKGFKTGEGVRYDQYGPFQDFMGQLADAKHCSVLVETFLPSIRGGELVDRLRSGIRVCDLGCAKGVAVTLMAEAFPRSTFFGIDISEEAIEKARTEARRRDLRNLSFRVLDAASLQGHPDLVGTFDYVTAFDAIHDQTRPLEALKGSLSLLKDGGWFSMVDIAASSHLSENRTHPMGPFLYTVSLMHCLPVGLVDGGRGLGMMWGKERAVGMLREAGFTDIEVMEIPEDPFNLHFFCRRRA